MGNSDRSLGELTGNPSQNHDYDFGCTACTANGGVPELPLLSIPRVTDAGQLSRWCTIDVQNSMRQMTSGIFGPELAKRMSLKGQNQKICIGNTHVFEVVSG